MKDILRRPLILTGLFMIGAFSNSPIDSTEAVGSPSGSWNGTAPFCDGSCSGTNFAYCVADNDDGPCRWASNLPEPVGFGSSCWTGDKAYCSSQNFSTILSKASQLGTWNGTAPFCDGNCPASSFAFCRSDNGNNCEYASGINTGSFIGGFGDVCLSGSKAFCIPKKALRAEMGICYATVNCVSNAINGPMTLDLCQGLTNAESWYSLTTGVCSTWN